MYSDWSTSASVYFMLAISTIGLPSVGKESACNAGEKGSIPGSERSPGGGHGNPLQYSCLGNPTDRGAWWAIVNAAAKSPTCLSN